MILSDTEILEAVRMRELCGEDDPGARRLILIEPFDVANLGGNSYDVHLSEHLKIYSSKELDAARDNAAIDVLIPPSGLWLEPGVLYLASTVEYTETRGLVPYVDGKSSVGRLGIRIHATAGRGDDGFQGHWTLEIDVVQPVRVYAGMPIGQLTYHTIYGDVERRYATKAGGSGYGGRDPRPQTSRLWKKIARPG